MSAAATFADWATACLSSGQGGGSNLLRIGREKYVIGAPEIYRNGAFVGRVHRFTQKGLSDIGGYKIAADGRVVDVAEPLREHLRIASSAIAQPVAEDVQ